MYKTAIHCLIGLVAIPLMVACASVSEDGKNWIDPGGDASADEGEGAAKTTAAVLTDTSLKYCSIYTPGNWRDTITVQVGWSVGSCGNYANLMGATYYQLGCSGYAGTFWVGSPAMVGWTAGTPYPNCGW